MSNLIVNNDLFSWSVYRNNLLDSCPRKYFYQYYGAWEGWDINANQENKHLYLLKNIKTTNQAIIEVTKKTILESIRQQNNFESDFKAKYFSEFANIANAILNENWKYDPKAINLFEIYYKDKEKSKYDIIDDIKNQFMIFYKIFTQSLYFQELSKLEYLNFYDIKKIDSFYLGELEIWATPDLIYKKAGYVYSVNFGYSESHLKKEVIKMYIENKLRIPQDKIISQFFDLNSFELKEKNISLDTENIIIDSASRMLNYIYDDTIYEANFTKCTDKNICVYCKFKEYCLMFDA